MGIKGGLLAGVDAATVKAATSMKPPIFMISYNSVCNARSFLTRALPEDLKATPSMTTSRGWLVTIGGLATEAEATAVWV